MKNSFEIDYKPPQSFVVLPSIAKKWKLFLMSFMKLISLLTEVNKSFKENALIILVYVNNISIRERSFDVAYI